MVLTDVQEVWKRRKLHYCHNADIGHTPDSEQICLARLRSLNIDLPQTMVKSLNRKFVECTRHVPQLMIRGEQIALITVDCSSE